MANHVVDQTREGLEASLRVAVLRLARVLRNRGGHDELTPTLFSALGAIRRQGPLTLGELAAVERVQPPSMTRIVARLEGAGLIAREVDRTDRRVVRVQLSARGDELINQVRHRKDVALAAALDQLDHAEMAALQDALPVLGRLAELVP